MKRRHLLAGGICGVGALISRPAGAQTAPALSCTPPRRIARLDELRVMDPVVFGFPEADSPCMLVKLGRPAEGGVGAERDVVAFSTICPHLGCNLAGSLARDEPGVLGPCPCHFSTFDLAQRGELIEGQATQPLPQIELDVVDGVVFAVGVRGYLYGFGQRPSGAAQP